MKTEINLTHFSSAAIITVLIFFASCLSGQAQTGVFTYQGRLTDSQTSGNGSYLLKFELYADEAGSNLIDSLSDVPVTLTNNTFAAKLNFTAANAFDGGDRYLKISVKRQPSDEYTPLAPLQPVTNAPYAIRAKTAATADSATNAQNVGGVPAASVIKEGDSRLTDARTPTAGSADYVQNATTQQSGANFNIGGTGKANVFDAATQYNINGNRMLGASTGNSLYAGLYAGSVNTGVHNAFFGAYAGLSNTTGNSNTFVGAYSGQSQTTGNGNSFFGTSAGYNNTTGSSNSFFGLAAGNSNLTGFSNAFVGWRAGQFNSSGGGNSFFGAQAGFNNTTGENNTVIGYGADVTAGDFSFATAIGSGATVAASNTIALGRSNGSDKVVVYGLGAAGATQLCRNESNQISACSSSLRYKTNFAPYKFGLNLINQLNPIVFDWKQGGRRDLGFGAEDVAKIEPLLVNYNKDGEIEGVKYDRMSVAFVNAFKEQQQQIEAGKTENLALKRQIEAQADELLRQQQQIKQQQSAIEAVKKLLCAQNPTAEICQ